MIKVNFVKSSNSVPIVDFELKSLTSDIEFQISKSAQIDVGNNTDNSIFTFFQDQTSAPEMAPLVLLSPFEWSKDDEWKKINGVHGEDINLSVLHGAHIFGGRIRRRNSKFHDYSQLLLNSRYELTNNSFGILDGSRTLPSDLIKEIDGSLYLGEESIKDPISLEGDFFFIGSIHRHFGHFLVEGLSRLWAIDYIPRDIKDNMSFLVYEDSLPEFAIRLLELLGIPLQKIVHAPKHAIIERLFVPDISYKTHHWASGLMQSTYDKISSSVAPQSKRGRKIYLSRKHTSDRPLDNENRIEDIFSSFGFDIISPEKLSIEEQVATVKDAIIIAGPVGSQMYLSSFSKAKKTIVLAPNNFFLPDDVLLSNIRGGEAIVCFGSAIDYTNSKENRRWTISEDHVVNMMEQLKNE